MKSVFILLLFLVAVYGQTFTLPHGHALIEFVDEGFMYFDKNQDGFITFDEVSYIPGREDLNSDGYITLEEYVKFTNISIDIAQPIFNAYDTDNDGRWPVNVMEAYFHHIDPNGDGKSSKHEYEHYTMTFLQCVFGHHTGGHGHGSDCSQRR